MPMIPSDGLTPEEVAIGHEGMLRIYRDQLSDWERTVVVMRFELLWPFDDIAYSTGRTSESVKVAVDRIKKRLTDRYRL